jgi:hypothetical protein
VRYALFICSEEHDPATQDEATMARYGEFYDTMSKRGVLKGGDRLRPIGDATTVQVRDGALHTTDGPFAETKEQNGGYFDIECRDLDEAVEIAAAIPAAEYGTIEVRPIWEM